MTLFKNTLISQSRKIFYYLPEPMKMIIVKIINDCLLYFYSR
jgi:hypothetical protein